MTEAFARFPVLSNRTLAILLAQPAHKRQY